MAAKVEEAFGVKSELIPKGGGVFDVMMDDELVYSKFKTGTFPDNEQLVQEMQR